MNGLSLRVAAERALADRFEPSVRLRLDSELVTSDRSIVARFQTANGSADAPQTFIVKAATGSRLAIEMLMNEWAATQLLSELPGDLCLAPRFYGGDISVPLVVLEDLGSGKGSPYELLEADDSEAATASLLAYIREVARLHMYTRGLLGEFRELRHALGSPPPPRPLFHDPWADAGERAEAEITKASDEYRLVMATAGVDVSPGVNDEIAEVAMRVECDPGPWLSLCQGDQNGLGHCMLAEGRLRLYDFGVAGFRHALIEGLPHRITWGAISRLPGEVLDGMDNAYRETIATIDPTYDDHFVRGVADALARWHIFHVIWRLPDSLKRDRPRGSATLRQQLVAGIDAFVETSAHPVYPLLADAAARLARRLRELWPSETHSIPYFPADRRTTSHANA